jgi:hypothetical protein
LETPRHARAKRIGTQPGFFIAEKVVCAGASAIDLHRFFQVRLSAFLVTRLDAHLPPETQDPGAIGVILHGGVQRLARFRQFPEGAEDLPSPAVRLVGARIELQGSVAFSERFLVSPSAPEDLRADHAAPGVLGVYRDGLIDIA